MQGLSKNIRVRRDYSKIKSIEDIPNLIDMQKNSYEDFLQIGVDKANRKNKGLQFALSSVFPIHSSDGRFILEFVEYSLDESKYDIDECKQRGTSYSSPVKIKLRLISNDINRETGSVTLRDIKEQDIYLCDIPLMTEHGTFVINGTERVVVSQIYRSPGIFFDHDKGKSINGKLLFSASIIPHAGSWLDIEFDGKDILNIRIDKRKKISLMALLKSLDSKKTEALRIKAAKENKFLDDALVEPMSNVEILETFYNSIEVKLGKDKVEMPFWAEFFKARKLPFDLINAKDETILIAKDVSITTGVLKKITKTEELIVKTPLEELIGKHISTDLYVGEELICPAGAEITVELLETLIGNKVKSFSILLIDNIEVGSYILNTILVDKIDTRFKALNEIYKVVKSADAPNEEVASDLFHNLFFNHSKYDLSEVGRVKINERLGISGNKENVLNKIDIIETIKTLIKIRDAKDKVDDIDHLGNRRIRSVGELIENDLRVAFLRVERIVQEKMATSEEIMPSDVINVKAIQSVLREFFGSSQLSQFMDQTNPLSEITHKRRISALGPKGLTRERANFEVRDVHVTHYGRICPIETPEGPNIGLINSLAVFAKINKYGFLETPYRKVVNGVATFDIVYMGATLEGKYTIAQSTTKMDSNNKILDELVSCRIAGEVTLSKPSEVEYMDVSPKQLVSVAASLVPFLENDDANRALMGANMQRQAVPLLRSEAPIIGTGMERIVARDSGVAIVANNSGEVHQVDGSKIIVKAVDSTTGLIKGVDVYNLKKFQRSNHNTCINQKAIVSEGDIVTKGEVIADGHSIDKGELALGKNILVAFMPWNGYNFEDSILVSEKVVRDDVFTSIHIEEFEVVARDTKLGAEEITGDIPNVGDEGLKNLDQSGIVYVGAEVKAGDILVGKVTPKAESVITAEEKLLRAIFGEKATDVKDTSLKMSSGMQGTVIGVRVFSRRGIEKDSRSEFNERSIIEKLSQERDEEFAIIEISYVLRISNILDKQEVVSAKDYSKGSILDKNELVSKKFVDLAKIIVKNKKAMDALDNATKEFEIANYKANKIFEDKVTNLQKGDDLPAGVLKMVKVFIAVKRKLQPGDKMAGRHGNKGVVSKILPVEDMPHLEDGTPVDICLNPLGVPSRMNVGQILEVHMGWACVNIGKQVSQLVDDYYASKENIKAIKKYLLKVYGHNEVEGITKMNDEQILCLAQNIRKGLPVATSVFDGVKEKDIDDMLSICGLNTSGQVNLVDGRTGEMFERPVTVGYIYMLKLHHLVDDKIHARSIGPYSLITQQPLGGKAQFGGQRFGEMEVWALEAYGAAYILQEMLTVKSDDQTGRTHVYDSIIKGDETFSTGIPESFNVLVRELRSLCLNLEMKKLDD